jgi:putative PEP-CTERM system TPR-repeat lipoprotein
MDRIFKMNLIAAVCCIGLVGCDSKSPEELMSIAAQHAAENNNAAAIIELKNAIGQAPDLITARLAIADLYYKTGQVAAAEKELIKARDLGASDNLVLPKLSEVFYYSDQFESAVNLKATASLSDPIAKSTVVLFQYIASLRSNISELTIELSDIENQLLGDNLAIAEAYKAFSDGNVQQLEGFFEQISSDTARSAEVAFLKAKYNENVKDFSAASESFAEVNRLVPVVNSINFLYVNALMNADDLDEAKKQIVVLSDKNPKHPVTNLFKANIAYREQNYEDAAAFSDVAIQNGSDTVTARIIGAVSAYKLKSMEKSYRHLVNLSERENFKNGDIDRLLSLVQLNLGYTQEAAISLNSIEDLTEKDAYLLSSAGMQLAKQGDLDNARSLLGKVQELDSDNSEHKMRSAIIEIGNNEQAVISNLKQVLALDESSEEGWIELALSHARTGNKAEAMKAAQAWQEKSPIGGLILQGRVYLELKQPSHAIDKFREAIKLDGSNENAKGFLLQAYEKSLNYSGLYSTAVDILEDSPNNKQAMLGLIKAGVSLGRKGEVDKTLNKLLKKSPNDETLYVMLAINAKLHDDKQSTIDILEPRKTSTNEMGLMTLGDAYSELKEYDKASQVFELWRKMAPKSIMPMLRLIGVKALTKDYTAAFNLSEKSVNDFPFQRIFVVLKMIYQVELGKFDDARSTLQALQQYEGQQETIVSYYEGQIALHYKEFTKAEKLLGAHYKISPSFLTAVSWARSLLAVERKYEAKITLEKEVAAVEKPTVFMRHTMAEFYSQNGYYKEASAQYKQLLEEQGDSVLVLNNLATAEQRAGNLDGAREYATKAVKLIPDNPTVLDTLGWIEYQSNNLDEAFKHLFMASRLSPESNGITLHLAAVQIALGQNQQAKKLLDGMSKLSSNQMKIRAGMYQQLGL